jgi:3-dehydroquinate synthetase
LKALGLPTDRSNAGLEGQGAAILRAMLSDKKASAQGLTLILTQGIGKAVVAKAVDQSRLADFLESQS